MMHAFPETGLACAELMPNLKTMDDSTLPPQEDKPDSGSCVGQLGALCYRTTEAGGIEILLITTRETKRWTIPKGWPIEGRKPHQVAEQEAWEEAGVVGHAKSGRMDAMTISRSYPTENGSLRSSTSTSSQSSARSGVSLSAENADLSGSLRTKRHGWSKRPGFRS